MAVEDAYVSLVVKGPIVEIAHLNSVFGVEEEFHPLSSQKSPGITDVSWSISTENKCDSADIEDHLHLLLQMVVPRIEHIHALTQECVAYFSCFLASDGYLGQLSFTLSPEILARLAAARLHVVFDGYLSDSTDEQDESS